MQYSMYAFIPLGILLALTIAATGISLWPKARRPTLQRASLRPIATRPSAEILYFPLKPETTVMLGRSGYPRLAATRNPNRRAGEA